jgi:hypothetical protein
MLYIQLLSVALAVAFGLFASLVVPPEIGIRGMLLFRWTLHSLDCFPYAYALMAWVQVLGTISLMIVDYIAKKGYYCSTCTGISMWPSLGLFGISVFRRGDPEVLKALTVGQIVSYRIGSTDTYFLHRIISIDKTRRFFIAKGDNNKDADPYPVAFSKNVNLHLARVLDFGRTWHLYLFPRIILLRIYEWMRFKKWPFRQFTPYEYYY